jgi:hypothetical protein
VRGGPGLVTKDVDFCVKPDDSERALEALAEAGMSTERPPEGWLFKAWDGDILVDLLFAPADIPVSDKVLARADELNVLALPMRVASVDDVLATKLLSLSEHSLDYEQLLQLGRGLREQIHWGPLRQRTKESPYALAFFTLVEELGVASAEDLGGAGEVPPDALPAPAVDEAGH